MFDNNIIELFNNLIKNNGISVKKLYNINSDIIDNNLLDIKNIYCKYKNKNNKFCLKKCIDNSKYCSTHDPIKKEEKRVYRKKLRFYKKEINKLRNLECIYNELYNCVENIPFEPLPKYNLYPEPSAPNYEEIDNKLTGNILEDIPIYEQKPDEVGCVIKNNVNRKIFCEINNEKIINVSKAIEDIGVSTFKFYENKMIADGDFLLASNLKITNIIENRNEKLLEIINKEDKNIFPIIEPLLLNNKENEEIITNIEDYKLKLTSLDYNNIVFKGINYQRLYRSTIELQFKLLLSKNNNININSKLMKFINNIVKRLPK
jgi:hypothetical protein